MSRIAVGAVAGMALVLAGCDALFDDQITPYDGPDFVEFGQVCPPNPATQCYQRQVDDDADVVEVQTNLIGPHRSSSTEMRFRFVERIFTKAATLVGQPGFTTVEGNVAATVVDDTNETFLIATISGATAGARHPWRVYTGTCDDPGQAVGSAGDYPVLEVGPESDARAEATLNVALEFGAGHHARVFASEGDMGTLVACGNMSAPTVMYETTAEEGVHFSLPQGQTYTLPANSSFGHIQVDPIEGALPAGQTTRVVIELTGAADGSIMPAGPGPERPRAHHMRYFTLIIRGT